MSDRYSFSVRQAERDAFCRYCDETINKNEYMISGYSRRNRGQYIHFHLKCVTEMNELVIKHGEKNNG